MAAPFWNYVVVGVPWRRRSEHNINLSPPFINQVLVRAALGAPLTISYATFIFTFCSRTYLNCLWIEVRASIANVFKLKSKYFIFRRENRSNFQNLFLVQLIFIKFPFFLFAVNTSFLFYRFLDFEFEKQRTFLSCFSLSIIFSLGTTNCEIFLL